MKLFVKQLADIGRSPAWTGAKIVASITGVLLTVAFGVIKQGELTYLNIFIIIVFGSFLALLVAYAFYSIRGENSRLRACAQELHDINHIYRNCLSRNFRAVDSTSVNFSHDKLLELEQEVLGTVCQKIGNIFQHLIECKCMVTVKGICGGDGSGSTRYCKTLTRSEKGTDRDKYGRQEFNIGTRENTGFDESLRPRTNEPSHFRSADLEQLHANGHYSNTREGWVKLYKSTIVVPIRYYDQETGTEDNLGFLCVDTLEKFKLGDAFHVSYMAAFADQMYNFMMIMRGRYRLSSSAMKRDG